MSDPLVSVVDSAGKDEVPSQHIRDLKLAIEYKHCSKHAPGGVFAIPQLDSSGSGSGLRHFDGVIFVRRGMYRNGVFRFSMKLSDSYNSINSHPHIVFQPPVFNPFIHPETGAIDLKLEPVLKEWLPEKHFLTTALTYVKKIFYMKTFDGYGPLPNEEARQLFNANKDKYLEEVQKTVEDSLHRVYQEQPPNCMLVFTEPKPAHDIIREKILANAIESKMEKRKLNDSPTDKYFHGDTSAASDAEDD